MGSTHSEFTSNLCVVCDGNLQETQRRAETERQDAQRRDELERLSLIRALVERLFEDGRLVRPRFATNRKRVKGEYTGLAWKPNEWKNWVLEWERAEDGIEYHIAGTSVRHPADASIVRSGEVRGSLPSELPPRKNKAGHNGYRSLVQTSGLITARASGPAEDRRRSASEDRELCSWLIAKCRELGLPTKQ